MTTVEKVKNVIDNMIAPALATHGGSCSLVKFDDDTKTAYVKMEGACGSCPFALETLRLTIEQAIISEVPEVKAVERA